jgi:hypothetical protein
MTGNEGSNVLRTLWTHTQVNKPVTNETSKQTSKYIFMKLR